MYVCSRCKTVLSKRKSPALGFVWVCPSCHGRAMTLELLRKAVSRPVVNRLWQRARTGHDHASRSCPACKRRMAEVPVVSAANKVLSLDVCTGCHFIWFDPREFEALPKAPAKPQETETLSPQAREAIALQRLDAMKEQESTLSGIERGAPDHWWELVIGLCGIPVEYNDSPLKSQPIVTWLLAAVIAAVSLSVMAFGHLEAAMKEWGLIPAEFTRHMGLTFVTSFFLHGGLFHLIGNLYFLIVFGDNTEDVLGKRRFLILVAVALVAGDIAHILGNPQSTIPCIGASGGISGVLAYYCLRFPRASVGLLWWYHYWCRVPVGIMFALWVFSQIAYALWIPSEAGGVAVLAHLGGAAVGVVFWAWTQHRVSVGAAAPSV